MIAAIALGLTMTAAAALGYQALGWSLDTPVLRRAMRCAYRAASTWASLALGLTCGGWASYRLGDAQLSGANVAFSSVLALFGIAAGLLCVVVAEDVGEMVQRRTPRLGAHRRGCMASLARRSCLAESPRSCGPDRRCCVVTAPCGAAPMLSHSWRPADRQRTGQPH